MGDMIRYTRGNRTRDIVGCIFLAIACTLLWVEHALGNRAPDDTLSSDDAVPEAVLTSGGYAPAHG
jgi:hypothetical protein